MLHVFVNGEWTTQELKEREIFKDYKIERFNEWHINHIKKDFEEFPSEILSNLIGLKVHTDWEVYGSTYKYTDKDEIEKSFNDIVKRYP